MKKSLFLSKWAAFVSILCPPTLFAFNIQVGISCKSQRTGLYYWGTAELGKTPSYCLASEGAASTLNNLYGIPITLGTYDTGTSSGSIGTGFFFNDTYNTSSFSILADSYYPAYTYTPKMGVPVFVEEMGYSYRPYVDRRFTDSVLTMRGDPYSLIINTTKKDLTINGVEIPAGESKRLIFPVYLAMEEVENIVFKSPTDHTVLQHYFHNLTSGPLYIIGWTGDILITINGEEDSSLSPTNFLPLYADIKSENQGKLLYAKNGAPVHQSKITLEEVALNTEWAFSQAEFDTPVAYINGVKVCEGHSTGHIISHKLNTNSITTDFSTGIGSFTFTMSLTASSGGGNCTMRCWDSAYDTYDSAPESHRASISAGMGVATFKYTLFCDTGEWKVEPQ